MAIPRPSTPGDQDGRHPPSYGTMQTQGCRRNRGTQQNVNHDIVKRDATTAITNVTGDNRRARVQIMLLCYVRMMEPLAFYAIFPYIAQMTKDNGNMSDADVGLYSGFFESLFSAVQSVVLLFWGGMADRVGHKRMLVCSLSGMSVCPVLFGFSTSLWQMALFRGAAGLFSGSNVMVRSLLMHHCTPDTQARTFSWYTFADNIALFAGPLLGGALVDPATQYPDVFGSSALFKRFPYALPGIVTGAACATGAVVTLLSIDEKVSARPCKRPIETKPNGPEDDEEQQEQDHEDGGDDKDATWPSLSNIIHAPGIMPALCAFMCVRILGSSMVAVATTALYTPVELGGLGFSSRQIAMLVAGQGAGEAVWLLAVFAPLYRRVGARGILNLCGVMFLLVFGDYMALNEVLRGAIGNSIGAVWYWPLLGGLVVLGSGVLMGSASSQLALQNMSPDPRVLGTLNAVTECCASIVKAVTPALSTAVFAVGVRDQILRGHLVWIVLVLISPVLFITVHKLPRLRGHY